MARARVAGPRLTAYRPGAGAFTPASISGLVAWYDASDAATITASGGAVSQWNDKSSSGFNLTQGTGSAQPTTGTRTQNSLNTLDFDGNDGISTASSITTQPLSFFAVVRFDTLGGGSYKIIFDNASGSPACALYTDGPTSAWVLECGSAASTGVAPSTGTTYVVTGVANGASSQVRVNGSQIGGTLSAGTNGLTSLALGTNRVVNNWLDGMLAEAGFYNSDVSAQFTSLESYLNTKWAVY